MEKGKAMNLYAKVVFACGLLVLCGIGLRAQESAGTGQPGTVQRYKLPDLPSMARMNIVVTRSDLGDRYQLDVAFTAPIAATPNQPRPFNLISIYGLQQSGPNGSIRHDLPASTFAPITGNWSSGDHIAFTIVVPKQYADVASGWDVRFCIGSSASCLPSPNLLTGYPIETPTNPEADAQAQVRAMREAFQAGKYAAALAAARQAIAASPENVFAHNIAGNSSLQLKDYAGADAEFKRALELQPDEYHNLIGLMEADTLGGFASERDKEREHLLELSREGKLPKGVAYDFDTFDVGDKKVVVSECPKLCGPYKFRYSFDVFDAQGTQVLRVALESADFDQPLWAKEHPAQAAAGGRMYSLDSYSNKYENNSMTSTHDLLRFYRDGTEPSYAEVRQEAIENIREASKSIGPTVPHK